MNKFLKIVLVFCVALVTTHYSNAQEQEVDVNETDSVYKEDQFYFGVTYNVLNNMPNGMSQNGFSSGFHLGFIKDMPINQKRNWALGLGLGISSNSFNQNLKVSKQGNGAYEYQLLQNSQFTKNKFSRYLLELPFEIRWRNSTPESYKFWRVYTGFKLGYLVASSVKFADASETIKNGNVPDFEKLQYGLTLSIGYNTWNAYAYYGLNKLFKSEAQLNNQSIGARAVKIGIMFYLL